MGGGYLDDAADFAGGVGEADEIGRGGGVGVFAVAVMFTHGFGCGDAVAEEGGEFGEGRGDCLGAGGGCHLAASLPHLILAAVGYDAVHAN